MTHIMQKILFMLVAAMTMVGCKKADTNNELKPFDVQQEFTDISTPITLSPRSVGGH